MFFALACCLALPLSGTASGAEDREAVAAFAKIFPGTKSIGIIYSDQKLEERISRLKESAKKHGIEVVSLHAPTIKEFPSALRDLKEKADTIWVLEDPLYSVVDAWKYFILFTLRAHIKTVVPNETALSQGGLFYYGEDKVPVINRRVLDILDLRIENEEVPIKYYGEN